MIKILKSLIGPIGLASLLLFGTQLSASSYTDRASTVMMNSLRTQPKSSFLRQLYTKLLFVPIWMGESKPSYATTALLEHIKNDGTLNKRGKLYQDALRLENRINRAYAYRENILDKVDLEFKLSQIYKAYVNYAYFGSINWGAFQARISNLKVNDVNTEWVLYRPNIDAIGMLEKAVFGEDLGQLLKKATPTNYHYKELQEQVAFYRKIQAYGGWPRVVLQQNLKPGESAPGVLSLRERLSITGEYAARAGCSEGYLYDHCLQDAVKRFQVRHGLSDDGEVGPGTLAALNVSVDKRIEIMLLNLDRIKWLRDTRSPRRVIINIPDFMLYFVENGRLRQEIRTIVGKPKNPTPIFSNSVKTIVLNPQWNVPKSIIQKEMIPKLLKNPRAMDRERIEVFTGWGKDAAKVDPATIDWSKYRYSKVVPFRFAQKSGVRNALGKVKFLFPNKFSVYMHDTPNKSLFNRSKRAFSHGCVRLQKPRELLETFSTFEPGVDFTKSQEVLKGKKKVFLSLEEQVPVDIVYLTAWVDYRGVMQFRNDIYGYDTMQLKSFRKW